MSNPNVIPPAEGRRSGSLGGPRRLEWVEQALTGTGAGFISMTLPVPANSRIVWAQFKNATAIGLTTGTQLGLGISGNPDSVILGAATLTAGYSIEKIPLTTTQVSADTLFRISSVDGSGDAAGSWDSGTVYVRIFYERFVELPDAE